MEYFSLLHLQKEPFSNSPDPEMFFQSNQHQGCLQKLEISLRLKRGLSVVIGDIGTGKSTLCRQLIRGVTRENGIICPYLILDPEFGSPLEFLTTLTKTFGIADTGAEQTEWRLKDTIKNYLLEQAIERGKILALIIDEGQKLPDFGIELLRELLNFETNQHKLLQIVIFAQEEFTTTLQRKPNFSDRISTFHRLRPLNFRETRAMIDFRLDRAHTDPGPPPKLFSFPAVLAIYCLTRGYPRRIVMLCSKIIIAILVSRDHRAGIFHVLKASAETVAPSPAIKTMPWRTIIPVSAAIAAAGFLTLTPHHLQVAEILSSQAHPQHTAPETHSAVVETQAPPPADLGTKAQPPTPVVSCAPSESNVPPVADSPPPIMGRLAIEPGVSLSQMIARVYGRCSPKKLLLVLQANPRITDPDRLAMGSEVTFPVLPHTEALAIDRDRVYLRLAQTSRLDEAYAVFKDFPGNLPPLLIVPAMAAQSHVSAFSVIIDEPLADNNMALSLAKTLPQPWQEVATPIDGNKLSL